MRTLLTCLYAVCFGCLACAVTLIMMLVHQSTLAIVLLGIGTLLLFLCARMDEALMDIERETKNRNLYK